MRGMLLSGAIWDFVSYDAAGEFPSLRLTAESSSVLDGEETCCPGIATHKSYYKALRGCGSTPPFTAPLCPLRLDVNLTYCNHTSTMAKLSLSFQTSLIRTASQRTLDHYPSLIIYASSRLK